jgi:hypothetical protein
VLPDHAVVVWANPDFKKKGQKRLLETIISQYSSDPIAFPISTLENTLHGATFMTEESELILGDVLLSSSEAAPVVIPTQIAEKLLGWTDFYIHDQEKDASNEKS